MPRMIPPLARLLAIMARLRDPAGGCPWDREQDFATIAPYTIEEAYEVADAAAQTAAWEEHKARERAAKAAARGTRDSVLDGVALALPALLRAAKIQQRAARIGFDWPQAAPVIDKLAEEIAELEAELAADDGGDHARIEDEMGDILFAAANLARKLDIDPEAALRQSTEKFERRFRRVEALAAERGIGADLDALEALWQEVKRGER